MASFTSWKLIPNRDASIQFIFLFGTPKALASQIQIRPLLVSVTWWQWWFWCLSFVGCAHVRSRQEHIKGVRVKEAHVWSLLPKAPHHRLPSPALLTAASCLYLSAYAGSFYDSQSWGKEKSNLLWKWCGEKTTTRQTLLRQLRNHPVPYSFTVTLYT